jgi:cobalamin biosynthesis protein CobT
MLSSRRKSALAKFLVSLYRMKMPKIGVSIRWLPKNSKELGYTYKRGNNACIYLNANQDGEVKRFFQGLNDSESSMFITGIAIHEFMHQILTNFVLRKKMIEAIRDPKEKELFKTVFNIFEDSRIESYAPSYFAGETIEALNFAIKRTWEVSSDINPEDCILAQVINAMIQYGDIGIVKPEMSDEAQKVWEKIIPLFNDATDSTSCAFCLTKAKKATEILLPYAEDAPESDYTITDSSDCDSEGEDAGDSPESKAARTRKIGKISKKKESDSGDSDKEASDDKSEDTSEDKTDSKSSGGDSDDEPKEADDYDTGSKESDDSGKESDSIYRDGADKSDCKTFDDDPEEVEDDCDLTESDFEAASKALEETLKSLEKAEVEAEKENESDYDFGAAEFPKGDKFVRTISHHKATPNPEAYEEYKYIVSSDAHELAKLIKRQFKTKPGRVKRADHGDLNLMRYKDPNFRSPLIFDRKKPKEKHCAAVMLLVDESGSMGGGRIRNARLAAAMLAEAMYEANIPCCVVGHSGDSKYDYSVELEHYTTFKNAPADRASIPMISARVQNRDGPAIRWASSILKKRPERNKLMIVISDGQPCADSYYGEDAIFDTKAAIRDAKRLHDIVGIILEAGSATDILKTMYGNDYIECNSAANLKNCIAKIITSKCKNW